MLKDPIIMKQQSRKVVGGAWSLGRKMDWEVRIGFRAGIGGFSRTTGSGVGIGEIKGRRCFVGGKAIVGELKFC